MKYLKNILLVLSVAFIFSCSKKEFTPSNVQEQDFVWRGMNAFYLWYEDVPNLSDTRFSSDQEYVNFLEGAGAPDAFFYNLLFTPNEYPKDPDVNYSFIVSDYIALEEALQGIRVTSGMKVRGSDFADGSGYYVYVYDVVSGSDADAKGVTRGMIITQVNGTTVTRDNVNSLFGGNSFTIHLADFNSGNPITNGSTISLSKSQVTENPIKIAKVIPNGTEKIGYLLYNQFSSDFDTQLNTVFADFKGENINDLIVDLRYNGGGSVQTAVYLASMITGQFTDQLFAKEVWNKKANEAFNPDSFINNFTNTIANTNQAINNLGLETVYFIVSERSASASELVINGLDAHINVKLVGEQTYGKHVGSITLYDSDNLRKGGPNFNTSHTWALQPIVLEIQNKNGENKPDGFIPEVMVSENNGTLGILGDSTEPLLARTIQYITTGAKGSPNVSKQRSFTPEWDSSMLYPDYNNMYTKLK